jgi:hypothetical protein
MANIERMTNAQMPSVQCDRTFGFDHSDLIRHSVFVILHPWPPMAARIHQSASPGPAYIL